MIQQTIDDRRELLEELEDHPLVEDVDATRDGFKTVILRLGEVDNSGGERADV